ncbi:MAG: hypothetical protein SFU53_06105 [Terrimicrobiaceae bacterium]|nr:hypothetical protein [Terrimicrobiaceae bacterium]
MKIPLPIALLLIALSLAVVGVVAYFQVNTLDGPEPVPVIDPKLPYQTEEAWTVREVAQSLADLAAFGAGKASQPVEVAESSVDGVYNIRSSSGRFSVDVRGGIWSPTTYSELATKMAGAPSGLQQQPVPDWSNLLNPGFQNLAEENRRISDWLTKEPKSADGHVQAALLLGTIGLNDRASDFRDPRRVMNRMTAHLALARALGVDEGDPAHRVASAMLLTLAGNQSAAVEEINGWPETDELAPWKSLLLLRNTGDWRLVEHLGPQTPPAVRNEFIDAMVRSITPRAGFDYIRERSVSPDVAIWRIFNEAPMSVQLGHVFQKRMLEFELAETAAAAKFYGLPVAADRADWLRDYLETPAGSVVVETPNGRMVDVAGRDIFADFHQRHLLGGISGLFQFLHDYWGVRDQAQQLREFVLSELPDLRLKPFLVRLIARTDDDQRAANPAGEAVIFKAPESVTPEMWATLRRDAAGKERFSAPDFHGWFSPEVPRQTAFETSLRLYSIGVGDENDANWLGELWKRSPFDYTLSCFNAFLDEGKSWAISLPVLDKWLAKILPYNVSAMKRRAVPLESDPVAYAEAMEPVIRFDPDQLIQVAAVAEKRGYDDLREKYLLRAFEDADNRVWMANESPWLVARLYESGRVEKAREVADAAAEVYSYSGLQAAIWLAEAEGRWKDAMELARKTDERYNEGPSEQVACYLRMNERSPDEAAAFVDVVKEVFPDGIQKATLTDFSGPPSAGSRIDSASAQLERFGLKPGQIIVGLDGYRVDSYEQYAAIRGLREDPTMKIIAWDGQEYREMEGTVAGRRFHVEMSTYRK